MRALFILFFFISLSNGFAQEKYNDIAYPSHTYFLDSVSNEINFQSFLKRWKPYDDFVRIRMRSEHLHTGEKVVVKKPLSEDVLQVDLINGWEFDTLKTVKSKVCVGQPYKGEDSVSVQFLGDSFTKGLYFKYAFLESGYVPKVRLVGTREVDGWKGQFHEGRGGWTLQHYFSDRPENPFFFNPFWQPEGEFMYWGSTQFWKNCIRLKGMNSAEADFSLSYNCSGYDTSGFSTDGKRKEPATGDLMWDSEHRTYIAWNGRRWKPVETDELHWKFDYGKYLKIHRLSPPDVLIVMLGLNDFRNGKLKPDFTAWNRKIKELYCSYREAVPNGKFVLCTPCTSCGTLNNVSGDFTVRQNAVMWEVRRNIIEQFDNDLMEGFYVVDASAAIDNCRGYRTDSTGLQTGNPHPYLGYPQLGIPLAGFIQYIREQ